MINKIAIFNLAGCIGQSYKENSGGYNAWITIIDEEDRQDIKKIKNNFLRSNPSFKMFSCFFYDWSDEDQDIFIIKNIETMGPRKEDVQKIINFTSELINSSKVYNLGINCFAGISRSTAAGIIAWVLNGKSPEEALKEILLIRPSAWPNLRILKFASEILKQDIVNPVKKWKEKNKDVLYY